MKFLYSNNKLLLLLLLTAIINIIIPKQSLYCYGKGLIFSTKKQLASVPMAHTPYSGTELPTIVDLTDNGKMPPVGNQGEQGSCAAWSVAYALKSYQEAIEENRFFRASFTTTNKSHLFSPAFIYNQMNNGRDGGLNLMDAIVFVQENGCATLEDMPYNENDYTTKPNAYILKKAKRYRIDYWRQVNFQAPREVKAQLAAGLPVVFGATVDEGFEKLRGAGALWDKPYGKPQGRHAMVLVGYNDQIKAYKIMNSWGTDWGDKGYAWVTYSYLKEVANEGFVAKDSKNGPNPDKFIPTPKPGNIHFKFTQVRHNVMDQHWGNGMEITGEAKIPQNSGKVFNIVVYFYFNHNGRAGKAVRGLLYPNYSDIYGNAATATNVVSVDIAKNGVIWTAFLPYSALDVPKGGYLTDRNGNFIKDHNGQVIYQHIETDLFVQPVLFIDGFGVKIEGLLPFKIFS